MSYLIICHSSFYHSPILSVYGISFFGLVLWSQSPCLSQSSFFPHGGLLDLQLDSPIQVKSLGEDKQLSLLKSRNQWIKIYLLYSSTYKWTRMINFWSLKILSIKALKSYMIKLLLGNLLWMLKYFFRKCLHLFFKNHLCSWRSFIFLQG